jgi:hypothetical protein
MVGSQRPPALACTVAFSGRHPVFPRLAFPPENPEYPSGSSSVALLAVPRGIGRRTHESHPVRLALAVLRFDRTSQIGLPIVLGLDGVYRPFVGTLRCPYRTRTVPAGAVSGFGGGGRTCIVHGISTPQSPQKRPSSATQRKAPHRSHLRGSSGSFRQTMGRSPGAPRGSRYLP